MFQGIYGTVFPDIPEPDRAARLGEIKRLIEALPCERYWGTPGPKHCRRCEALAKIDEEIRHA